jgi:prefoldin subunit 5
MSTQQDINEPAQQSDSTVELGDVRFDPVAIQDFRLSIEGTSSTGKSNTLSVILEDLASVALPTLIIERLGALTPTRLVDDNIVVVGARDEEGVDLAVALEDLDKLGKWVLDRGMKILLDISTYADYEDEKSRVHLAAAKALRSLNDRAHAKYRSGDRTKSLLILDEAHWLAPKDSAPNPELDEFVKRCRGQLIKASTEGGNKGISIVVGYQRRAFIHNGVIQLAQDFVAHQPGDEDVDRTADALRCSEEALSNLERGHIMARGQSITDGDLIGPTKVRKRSSPDPREDTFELPDTPDELADALESIQDEVEADRERRQEREDELEQLRAENERLRDRVEELEEELENTDRLASALQNLQGNGGDAARDVGEAAGGLQERVAELKAERDDLEATVADLREERDELADENQSLQDEVADLEADVQELRSAFDGAAAEIEALAERFDVAVDVEQAGGDTATTDDQQTDVQQAILAEFQEDAVDRIVGAIRDDLSERQRDLLRYIESRGQTLSSQKAWAQNALGISGNPGSDHYDAMRDLVENEWVRKNNDGSIAPNVRGRVEDELAAYDAGDDAVEQTYQQVLSELA